MNLLIVSNAPLIKKDNQWFAYSPYVNEIEIWAKFANNISFCCPEWKQEKGLLISKIPFSISKIFLLSDFNLTSFVSIFKSFFQVIYNFVIIFKAMIWANHIHLRCPGNIGLLASIVQIFFPYKTKTAKYAGNWDPNAKNPVSYKLQTWILSNTFLTRNMQVLVYGEWQNQSKNIKPFFTASYKESEKTAIEIRNFQNQIRFLFVGMLTSGKNPKYAIQIIEKLKLKNQNISLDIYGEGLEREFLEKYIAKNNLQHYVSLKGNQNLETLKNAYSKSHFLILPSDSEGWPKAVAEAMFWGCLPISTNVSCVADMLDNGNSGLLLSNVLEVDVSKISQLIENETLYQQKVTNAVNWSRKYTLDLFEKEIKLLLHQ